MPKLTLILEVPEGMTEQGVFARLCMGLSGRIGDKEHPGEYEKVLSALVNAELETNSDLQVNPEDVLRELCWEDLAYLCSLPRNDWQRGWHENTKIRSKLEGLKLVISEFDQTAKYRHGVNSTTCNPTELGLEVLRLSSFA